MNFWGGVHEIQNPKTRYRLIDHDRNILAKASPSEARDLSKHMPWADRCFGLVGFMKNRTALVGNDVHVYFPCVQIDAAIRFVLLVVKSHGCLPFFDQWANGRGHHQPTTLE
jgi:hypothetical protein